MIDKDFVLHLKTIGFHISKKFLNSLDKKIPSKIK